MCSIIIIYPGIVLEVPIEHRLFGRSTRFQKLGDLTQDDLRRPLANLTGFPVLQNFVHVCRRALIHLRTIRTDMK